MHAVYSRCRQQGFGAGNERHGKSRNQQGWISEAEQVRRFQPVDGFGQVLRHFDPFHLQRQQQTGARGQTDAEQRTGNETQRMRAKLLPQPHHRNGRQAEQSGLPAERRQGLRHCAGERREVIQPGRLRFGIEHHMDL